MRARSRSRSSGRWRCWTSGRRPNRRRISTSGFRPGCAKSSRSRCGWFGWFRKPAAVGLAATVLLALGVGSFLGRQSDTQSADQAAVAAARGTAVSDLQYLEKHSDLLQEFEALDVLEISDSRGRGQLVCRQSASLARRRLKAEGFRESDHVSTYRAVGAVLCFGRPGHNGCVNPPVRAIGRLWENKCGSQSASLAANCTAPGGGQRVQLAQSVGRPAPHRSFGGLPTSTGIPDARSRAASRRLASPVRQLAF